MLIEFFRGTRAKYTTVFNTGNITGAICLFLNITGAIAPVAPMLNTPLAYYLKLPNQIDIAKNQAGVKK